jgi:hypothetical protein
LIILTAALLFAKHVFGLQPYLIQSKKRAGILVLIIIIIMIIIIEILLVLVQYVQAKNISISSILIHEDDICKYKTQLLYVDE